MAQKEILPNMAYLEKKACLGLESMLYCLYRSD